MSDLTSSRVIVTKGVLFLLLVVLSSGILVLKTPDLQTIALIIVLVWSSARLYYFLFYVLERYVDPSLKYSGLLALAKGILSSRSKK